MRDHLDTQIRELTFKLVHLAPEAPPFPEVSMATLTPEKQTSRPRPPRRLSAAWAAAAAFVVVLLIGIPLLFFRGDPEPVTPATTVTTVPQTTVTTVSVAVTSFDVTVYYLADYVEASNVPGPHLVPLRRNVSASTAAGEADLGDQVGAAIRALIEGPSADDAALIGGVSSAIPEGTELLGLILDRTGDTRSVVLDFNPAFESGGGTFSMTARLAQVVYTATQFGDIDAVEFTIDGETVDVFSSEGLLLDGPQARDDYRDLLPLIFAEQPLPGDIVTSPIEIVGVANTFEAGVEYLIELADGTVLGDGFTTASCGTGCWGDFTILADYTLDAQAAGFVVLKESSARDGSPTNVVRIPVTFEPAEGSEPGEALYLEAGLQFAQGSAYFSGIVVAESPLVIEGAATPGAAITVNGVAAVPGEFGAFSSMVDLEAGENKILLRAELGDQIQEMDLVVTYVPGGETNFAFLTQVTDSELGADYAQWLTGDEANQAAFEDGVIGSIDEGVPNDYYIRNTNDLLRTLPIAEDVVVMLVSPVDVTPIAVDIEEWVALFKPDGTPWDYEAGDEPPTWDEPYFGYYGASSTWTPYWLTLDADGTVIQIVQQYLP